MKIQYPISENSSFRDVLVPHEKQALFFKTSWKYTEPNVYGCWYVAMTKYFVRVPNLHILLNLFSVIHGNNVLGRTCRTNNRLIDWKLD